MLIAKMSAVAALTAGFLVLSAPVSFAGSLDGTWLRPKTGAHVKSFACGGGLGLKVIKSKKKSARGKTIMCGAKKIGGASYKGNLTSTEDGKTYSGTATLSGKQLKLVGCAVFGLICKTEYWTRLK